MKETRFRYLIEPLFLISVALYGLNRFWLKPLYGSNAIFLRSYWNDVLFFPVMFPILLSFHRILGLRKHDSLPSWFETIFYLALWSTLLEWVFPILFHHGVRDWKDVVCYTVGMLVFSVSQKLKPTLLLEPISRSS